MKFIPNINLMLLSFSKFQLFLFCLLTTSIYGQHSLLVKVLDNETNMPLFGATVFIADIESGGISNKDGKVEFSNLTAGQYEVIIRFLGYKTRYQYINIPSESNTVIIIRLEHDHEELQELIVQSNRSSRTIEDVPTRVEIIAGEELSEKGNMKPGDIRMLLNESTGIQTQQTSATSYNSSIRIQGLDGKYTQLLRDGLPLYSGLSSGLSLMQIAPLDLSQVEVIKGASSTLHGGGAIAGLVNLISKKPAEESEWSFLLNGTSALGLDASSFYANKDKHLGMTVFTSFNSNNAYDPADIGLTAIPEFDRFTITPKLFWEINESMNMVLGVSYITEDRLGGSIDHIKGIQSNNHYFEANKTNRYTTELQLQKNLKDKGKVHLKNSISIFERKIEVPRYIFEGTQLSSFSEIHWSINYDQTSWIMGINLWTDKFEQSRGNDSSVLDYSLITSGFFAQNIWTLNTQWTVENGLRIDALSSGELFILPKISIMYKPNASLTLRGGGGLGYKSPTVFTEDTERLHFKGIAPIDFDKINSEKSLGTNLDINYRLQFGEKLNLSTNMLLFYTKITDPLVLEMANQEFRFIQLNGLFKTQGIELNMKWNYNKLKLFTGYTYTAAAKVFNRQEEVYPLVAKNRINNVLMYEDHGNFWIGLEAYYYSPQQLNDSSVGQSYWIMGIMSEKVIANELSIFLNFENILDTRQTAFDKIYTGDLSNPEFKDIYAPVDGFIINGGFKLRL